jgi:hypothetical protein
MHSSCGRDLTYPWGFWSFSSLFQIINKFEDFLSTLPFFDEIEEWSK